MASEMKSDFGRLYRRAFAEKDPLPRICFCGKCSPNLTNGIRAVRGFSLTLSSRAFSQTPQNHSVNGNAGERKSLARPSTTIADIASAFTSAASSIA
jgi:hypothetical protein